MAQEYQNLLGCYRSGQMSEAQWEQHLEDKDFVEWLRKAPKENRCANCSSRILNSGTTGENWFYNCANPDGWYFGNGPDGELAICPPVTDCPAFNDRRKGGQS